MDPRVRSLLTLGVLVALLSVAAAWGWSALRDPFPRDKEPAVCRDREFAKGARIKRMDVTVSVWNAGTRVGLAGLTMDLFQEAGFAPGVEGNTPGKRRVPRAQIWTSDPRSPAVRLVASHLGGATVVRREEKVPGVLVVVGDGFDDLTAGRASVVAPRATSVCGPPRRAR